MTKDLLRIWAQQRRERANRQCLAVAVLLLCGTALYGHLAWGFASWRAVGFAVCSAIAILCALIAVLLMWVATSVDGCDEAQDGGISNG